MLDTTNHSRQKSTFLRDFSVKKKKSNHTEIYCTNLYNTIQTYCQKNLKALRRAERGPLKLCGLNALARRRQNCVSPPIFSLTKGKSKPHKVFLRDSVQYQPKMLSKNIKALRRAERGPLCYAASMPLPVGGKDRKSVV